MPFPFNNAGDSLYYVNQQAYDLSSGTQWGSMNIHLNQIWDDLIARRGLYDVPVYDFSNFNQYTTPTLNNPFPQIMSYTMGQLDWQNKIGGGNGLFDSNGNFQAPWMQNPAQLWSSNLGWNPSASAGQGSAPKTETEEERDYHRKYNTLLSLTKQLVLSDELTRKEKDDLNSAIQNTKGTWKERYVALNNIYKNIEKDTVRKCLEKATDLGVNSEINSNKTNSFYKNLETAGYEYEGTTTDKRINDLYRAIDSIEDRKANPEDSDILGELQKENYANILDVISSYNSTPAYKNKKIIKLIAEKYNALEDKDSKETAKGKVLIPIVQSLLNKADDVAKLVDEKSKEKIQKAKKDVTNALNNSKDKVDSSLSDAFDTLYLLTRMGAIANLRNEAIAYYGEVDSEIFNKDLFADETIKDLKAEGFTQDEINKCEVKVKKEAKVETSDEDDLEDVEETDGNKKEEKIKEDKSLNKKTVEKQVETLISEDVIVKTTVKHSLVDTDGNTKEYEVYQTTKGNKQRVFIIKDDKIVELKNAKIENGKIVADKTGVAITEVEVEASKIKLAHEEAVKAEKVETERKAKEEAKAEKERKAAEEKTQATINSLIEDGYLKKHGSNKNEYIETRATGGRKEPRIVMVYDNKITVYNTNTGKWEEVSNLQKEFSNTTMTEKDIEEAKKIGNDIKYYIDGYTDDDDWAEIKTLVRKVNNKNILHVIAAFNDVPFPENFTNWTWFPKESFFTHCQSENKDDKVERITGEMLQLVIQYAENNISSLDSKKQEEVSKIISSLKEINLTKDTKGNDIDKDVNSLIEIFNIE